MAFSYWIWVTLVFTHYRGSWHGINTFRPSTWSPPSVISVPVCLCIMLCLELTLVSSCTPLFSLHASGNYFVTLHRFSCFPLASLALRIAYRKCLQHTLHITHTLTHASLLHLSAFPLERALLPVSGAWRRPAGSAQGTVADHSELYARSSGGQDG